MEQGANISDHAYRNPCKVVIRGASSESTYGLPVWDPYNATLYNALLALSRIHIFPRTANRSGTPTSRWCRQGT